MIILGVDPGFSFSGYSIIFKEKKRTQLLHYGFLKLDKKENLAQKIKTFYEFFIQLIDQWKITAVALETSFLGKNAQTFLKLGFLRGILYLLSAQKNLDIFEFAPTEIKYLITGFGGAPKDQVARLLLRLFPKIGEFAQFDISDAIAVALAASIYQQKS